jgi:putative transposase
MKQADIEDGKRAGLTTDERAELVQLRRDLRTAKMEIEILKRAAAYFAKESRPQPKMIYAFICRDCADLAVQTCCRVMEVSTSGFSAWREHPVSDKDLDDAYLANTIVEMHALSRGTYGAPRVHAELRLGQGVLCSKNRVERLMRVAGVRGLHRRRRGGCTRRSPDAVPSEDLVERDFDPEEPDRLWMMDVTEHPTLEGKVYLAVVLDAFSRMVIGWSIADHLRSELVVDALQMALWRRRPPQGQTIAHSDHGSTYTSWAFGRRLRSAGLLGSMGSVGDCFDNSVVESFFGTLQLELLDRQRWETRDQLALAIFEWIEAWYNPKRRHSFCDMLSPADYETAHAA